MTIPAILRIHITSATGRRFCANPVPRYVTFPSVLRAFRLTLRYWACWPSRSFSSSCPPSGGVIACIVSKRFFPGRYSFTWFPFFSAFFEGGFEPPLTVSRRFVSLCILRKCGRRDNPQEQNEPKDLNYPGKQVDFMLDFKAQKMVLENRVR